MTDAKIISALADWGCDTHGALERTLRDDAFLVRCLRMFSTDKHFSLLGNAIRDRDTQTAFECAHAIKGVAGNLGLTPLYLAVSEMVEPLRAGSLNGAEERYGELMTQYGVFLRCMGMELDVEASHGEDTLGG